MSDREIAIKLGLTGVQQVQAQVTTLSAEFSRLTGAIARVGHYGAGLGALALGASGVGQVLRATVVGAINGADALEEFSQRAGVSVEKLSALQYVGKQTGISNEQLVTSVRKLNDSLAESQNQNSKSAQLFRALGVETTDAAGQVRAADDVLLDLADRFAALPDGAQKSAAALDIFGKSGDTMITMLNEGSDGIRALQGEAERFGQVISTDTARQAAEFNDNLDRLKATMTGMANEVLPALLDGVNDLAVAFNMGGGSALEAELAQLQRQRAGVMQSYERGVASPFAIFPQAFKEKTLETIDALDKRIIEVSKKINEQLAAQEKLKSGSAGSINEKSLTDYFANAESKKTAAIRQFNAEVEQQRKDMIELYRMAYPAAMQTNEEFGEQMKEQALQWQNNKKSMQGLLDQYNPNDAAARKYLADYKLLSEYLSGPELEAAIEGLNKEFSGVAKVAEQSSGEIAQIYEDTASSIRGSFRGAFRDLLDGQNSFADRMKSTFKDLLADMATMAIARPIIIPMVSAMGGMMGVSGQAQAGVINQLGGGGGGFGAGDVGMLASIGGGLGAFGAGIGAGVSGGFGAASAAMSGAAFSTGTGALSAIGVGVGAALPWVAAALVLDKLSGGGLFGTGYKTKDSGLELSYEGGEVSGQTYKKQKKKKSLFRGSKSRTIYGEADDGVLSAIDATFSGVEQAIASGAQGLGISSAQEFLDGFSSGVDRVSLKGKSEAEAKKAIEKWTTSVAAEMYQGVFSGSKFEGLIKQFTDVSVGVKRVGWEMQQFLSVVTDAESVKAMGDALLSLGAYFESNAIADFAERQRLAERSLKEVLDDQYKATAKLAREYDGSIDATQALALATQERYQLEMQYLQQISAYSRSISDSVSSSVQDIFESTLNPAQKYDYFISEAEKNLASIYTSVDPEQVQKLSNEGVRYANSAFYLLGAGGASYAQEFIDFINEIGTAAEQRLTLAKQSVESDQDSISKTIEKSMAVVADKFSKAADDQRKAAEMALEAAKKIEAASRNMNNNSQWAY